MSKLKIHEDFWEQAKFLHKMLEQEPENFKGLLQWEEIGLRKAFHLVAIYRAFAPLGIPKEQLVALGWTRLTLLVKVVDHDNVDELLRIAADSTVYELAELLQGRQPKEGTRVMLLRLSPRSYGIVKRANLKFGGSASGGGLAGKEKALVKALKISLGE